MSKVIKISDELAKKLDSLRHEGQSYDGCLREHFGIEKQIRRNNKSLVYEAKLK